MSYSIHLKHPVSGEVLRLDAPHHMRGSTYAVGGTTEAHLNITYNYAGFFRQVLGPDGIRVVYGMSGAESLPILRGAAAALHDDVDDDYWKPTEGNAKAAIMQLIALAQMRPDGIWAGD